MALPTVNHRQRGFPPNPRARALTARIAELGLARPAEDARLEALALGLVDALLEADETTLRTALEALRDARGRALATEPGPERERLLGWLAGMIAVAHWALERLTPASTLAAVAPGSQAYSFLQTLERMWRALRDQGASPAASAQQASAAVEQWLEAHPAPA